MFTLKLRNSFPPLGQRRSPLIVNTKQRVRPRLSWAKQLEERVEQIERTQLDPLLDRLVAWWGDSRFAQHQLLQSTRSKGGLSRVPTAEERQINRGLYVSAASLGLAVTGALVLPPLRLLSLPGLLYGSLHLYKAAYKAVVVERTVDVNLLAALVNLAYVGSGMFVLGNLTATSYFFSRKLLFVVKDRFEQGVRTALMQYPQRVWTLVDGQEVQVQLALLKAGDLVIVVAGETVPVDGVVCAGAATLDQRLLTGEALPVERTVGERVFAATTVLTGKLHITVEQAGAETTVDRVHQILAQTVDYRSTRQLQVQQLTDRLVAPTLGLAALTLPLLGPLSAAAVIDAHPQRQLMILGSLALLNFLVAATRQGILVKDGRSLELLREVDTLVFDKTGTLTQEQPAVTAIHLCADLSEEQLLRYAAAAEQRQSHPLAWAILAEAEQRGLLLPALERASYHAGFGLRVTVEGQTIHVGSTRFMADETIAIPPGIAQLQETCHRQGHSLVLVAVAGQLAGALELHARLRPEVKTVLNSLRRLPRIKSIIILSGDQPAPTRRLAAEIGADDFFADVLPAGKADRIAQLQQAGRKVCFVGDGINDTVALKQANVSISLRGAASAATDTAHIVLMEESLQQLVPLFALVERFDATLRNTMIAILGPGLMSLTGIYLLGFGLVQTTILEHIGIAVGTTIAMRPWLLARETPTGKSETL